MENFFDEYYHQKMAEKRRKAALLRKIKLAALILGVICLPIIIAL